MATILLNDQETRIRLLDAAEEVFAERGFEAASVRQICERAGVKNIGAINYYFQNKERLYTEAVIYAFRCCCEGAPFREWDETIPPEEKLRDFIDVMMQRMAAAPKAASMQLMMREMTQPSAVCAEAVKTNIEPMAHLLKAILAEMIPNVPMDQRWLIGFSIVGQCLYYRQNRSVAAVLMGVDVFDKYQINELAQHIYTFSLAAIRYHQTGVRGPFRGQ